MQSKTCGGASARVRERERDVREETREGGRKKKKRGIKQNGQVGREKEREDRYTRLLINYPLRSLRRYNKIISGRLYRDSGCERRGRHKVAACAPTAAVINKATQPEKRRAA